MNVELSATWHISDGSTFQVITHPAAADTPEPGAAEHDVRKNAGLRIVRAGSSTIAPGLHVSVSA